MIAACYAIIAPSRRRVRCNNILAYEGWPWQSRFVHILTHDVAERIILLSRHIGRHVRHGAGKGLGYSVERIQFPNYIGRLVEPGDQIEIR